MSGLSVKTPSTPAPGLLELLHDISIVRRIGAEPQLERKKRVLRAEGVRMDLEPGGVSVVHERGRRAVSGPAGSRGTM
jgi:hypothetical protein